MAILVPAAFVLSPSFLNFPVDLALGLIIPVHAHIGWNAIAVDYVPKRMRRAAPRPLSASLLFALLLSPCIDRLTLTTCSVRTACTVYLKWAQGLIWVVSGITLFGAFVCLWLCVRSCTERVLSPLRRSAEGESVWPGYR
jgi:hypothetical protein